MPRIAILGDFDPDFHSHLATNAAIRRAAQQLGLTAQIEWLPTPELERNTAARLAGFDAVWASPGSPYRSFAGMLAGIRVARERNVPFTAT
jgi:CTP synthase (UTP-ammonia lyase)